jgi:large subunit ribosomal protein L31
MKKDIHPKDYRQVIFEDMTSGAQFLIYSTVATKETGVFKDDGKEYPLYRIEISSASHPVFTGKDVTVDTAGRVDKFRKRVAAASTSKQKAARAPKLTSSEEK